MPAMMLTGRFCDTVKPVPKKQVAYFDAHVRGLEFRVSGDGRKTWSLRYRGLDGKQRRLGLGIYPAVDLYKARGLANKKLGEIAEGRDPARERQQAKEQARAKSLRTFDALAEAYLEACERGEWQPKGKPQRARTIFDSRACHRRYVSPILGKLPVDEIKRSAVRQLLRDMAAKGIQAQTKRTHAFIRQVFAWAIAEFDDEIVPYNPAVGFAPIGKVKPRTRIYSDAELRTLWKGLEAPEQLTIKAARGICPIGVSRQMTLVIQLVAVTLQRKAEVAGMHERELDLENRTWRIPSERTKNGWPQLVPLTSLAIDLIKVARELRRAQYYDADEPPDREPELLFPSRNDLSAPVRGDSVTHAMGRVAQALQLTDLTVHDLRRTGATLMTSERLKVPPFIRSKVLGHRSDTGGGAAVSMLHYDANEYVSEKRQALEAWAELLKRIVSVSERST